MDEARRRKRRRSKGADRGAESTGNTVSPSTVTFSLAAIAVVLALVAVLVPGVRKPVGIALALPGLLVCLYGYATAVYIAFTEDDLYGWLFLLFPFYAAYYIVTRWDEMRSRVVMIVIGLTLLAIGGRFLEADRARAEALTPEAPKRRPRSERINESDHFADRLLLFEKIHRPAAAVVDRGDGSMPRLW